MPPLELDRRQVLVALAACGLATSCRVDGRPESAQHPDRVSAPATTTPDVRVPDEVALARRFSFGPTPDLIALAASGADRFFDAQLDGALVEHGPTAALVANLDAAYTTTIPSRRDDPAQRRELRRDAAATVGLRALAHSAWSTRQLEQVAADFFTDHLHVSIAEDPTVFHAPSYDAEVIRAGALGRFADLLVDSARSGAMLVYLDNATSRADRRRIPNENYARELLELHTVGIDGGYDERDVTEVAATLSGWSLDRVTHRFTFRDSWHDLGELGRTGDVLGWRPTRGGVDDGEDLLNHLARLPQTARFLCWKLARRFAADDIRQDSPLVDELATIYLERDTAIGPVLRAIGSRRADWGPKVRRPLDLVAAMLRMGTPVPDITQLRGALGRLRNALVGLGHVPYQWPAPNGFPEAARAWTGAGAMIARWNAAVAGGDAFGTLSIWPAPTPAKLLGHAPGTALAAATSTAADDLAVRALTFASPEFQLR